MTMTLKEINQLIGGNLRRMRDASNMSQEDLAKALTPPITPQQIAKYENGNNKLSSPTLYQMSLILDCRITDFFKEGKIKDFEQEIEEKFMVASYKNIPDGKLKKNVFSLIFELSEYLKRGKNV